MGLKGVKNLLDFLAPRKRANCFALVFFALLTLCFVFHFHPRPQFFDVLHDKAEQPIKQFVPDPILIQENVYVFLGLNR